MYGFLYQLLTLLVRQPSSHAYTTGYGNVFDDPVPITAYESGRQLSLLRVIYNKVVSGRQSNWRWRYWPNVRQLGWHCEVMTSKFFSRKDSASV